jgi:hypothetical protein
MFQNDYGLFCTNDARQMYPNPAAHMIPGKIFLFFVSSSDLMIMILIVLLALFLADYMAMMEFAGKLLGKALAEGILVDAHFAPFFLAKVLGRPVSCKHDCLSFCIFRIFA